MLWPKSDVGAVGDIERDDEEEEGRGEEGGDIDMERSTSELIPAKDESGRRDDEISRAPFSSLIATS